jgi:REP element-mobilizing transposase RayT
LDAGTIPTKPKGEHPMGLSLVKNLIHLVFSTKHRQTVLIDDICPDLYAYLGGICRDLDSHALCVGGVADHVHILFQLAKTLPLSKAVEEIKTGSSKWLKTKGQMFADFHWQNGYGAFSVSPSNEPAVMRYIERQEEHHRQRSFQDELRELLRRHGVEFDERYVWD